MRSPLFFLAMAALILALPRVAVAQMTSPSSQPATSQTLSVDATARNDSANGAGKGNVASQPDQSPSLGEIARLVRAKKSSQPKAVRIFDDENMPRAPLGTGLKAPSLDGEEFSGDGKVRLLDFWASWCDPCRESLPELRQLQAIYSGEGFELISIDEDENEAAGHRFVAQKGMNWKQHFDPKHTFMRQYGVSGFPTYVLIGKDGSVVQQYEGYDPYNPLVSRIGPDVKKSLQ